MSQERKDTNILIPFAFSDVQAFSRFIREIRFENRYFLSEVPAKFVDGLINYAKKSKVHVFPVGEKFFRARIHEFNMSKAKYDNEKMGPPPKHKATQGRLNPVGIPYLYLANDVDTAVSEVRPWIGCDLTVAEYSQVGWDKE